MNKELKRQRNVLTPVIIALAITLLLLLSSESEDSIIMLPEVQQHQKENLINVPREQAQLEVDKIVYEKAAITLVANGNSGAAATDQGTQFQLEDPFTPSLHNSASLVQHIWYRGDHFDGKTRPKPLNTTFPLAIDAISVASEAALVTLEGQVSSWGSHHSIRYFFGATEKDDADPNCANEINIEDMKKISEYCSGRAWKRGSTKVKFLRNRFARGDFMVRFRKTPGWMCAQQRISFAMGKLGRFYRNEMQHDPNFKLPDFLLLHDDDTYYNMVRMYRFLEERNPSQPSADAGCLVRMPVSEIAFDYPYGGFGMMVSRASIARWIRPVDCEAPTPVDDGEWVQHVCEQLKENLIGEAFSWKNGMSITDLMQAHAESFPYSNYQKWRQPGYCIHGDWALGYYFNYYALSAQSTSFPKGNEFTRIDQTLGYHYDKLLGNCQHEGQPQCASDSHVCHRLHGVSMSFVARLAKQEAPEQFRKAVKKQL
jgi:hypothetical protein